MSDHVPFPRHYLVQWSETLSNWSTLENMVAPTSDRSDPFGGTRAFLFDDSSTTQFQGKDAGIRFFGDGVKSFSVFIRKGSANSCSIRLRDETAGVNLHRINVTTSAAPMTAATAAGVGTISVETVGDYYRISASASSVTASNTLRVALLPVRLNNAGEIGTTDFFGVTVENDGLTGPYVATDGTPVFRLSHPAITHPPVPLAVQVRSFACAGIASGLKS